VDDLTAFVTARLDEREAGARELLADNASARATSGGAVLWDELDADARTELREAGAMRRILELARHATDLDKAVEKEYATAPRDLAADPWHGDLIVRALAAIWSDHPGYRPEWRA
jgi:Family of unknown function (DUF6221)